MTIRFVGPGGNNANDGLSWATRKLTLNGVEDTPVVAGDTVYVGPGTYRELLTVDVSGSGGSPITYIGDYTGANTDGVGGVVRITGSDNDQSATRANCITATTKNYRTFQGFLFDTTTAVAVLNTGGTNWIVQSCLFFSSLGSPIQVAGSTQANCTVQNCGFMTNASGSPSVHFTHTSAVDNTGHIVQGCLIIGGQAGVRSDRVGGITVRNSTMIACSAGGVRVQTALTVGQTITANNCIFQGCSLGLQATVTGEIIENYNTLFVNGTDRSNTATGANSLSYPALLDPRWFFQLVTAGAGPYNPTQFVSPFDLSSQSQLINLTGTNPPATDLRGTAIQQSQREWGVLEYDPTLSIRARQASSVDDGGMIVS